MPRASRRLIQPRSIVPKEGAVAVGYGRYSSLMQGDGWSRAAQERALREGAAARGWALEQVFFDEARSGADTDRPGLHALLARLRAGGARYVLAHKLDRVGRNLRDLLDIVDQLDRIGVALVCVADPIDTGDPLTGRLLLAILGTLAEQFLQGLSAETIKGKRERAVQGHWLGQLPWGYGPVAGGDHRAAPHLDPAVAALWRGAADLYDPCPARSRPDGLPEARGFGEVADWLNRRGARLTSRWQGKERWADRNPDGRLLADTVAHLLQNLFYAGLIEYADPDTGTVHVWPAVHPAVTDRAQIERIRQKARRQARVGPQAVRRVCLANGIVRCAACGRPLGLTHGVGGSRYRCPAARRGRPCPARRRSIAAGDLDGLLDRLIDRLVLPPGWRQAAEAALAEDPGAATRERRRAALGAQLGRVHDRYEAGGFGSREAYQARVSELRAAIAALPVPEPSAVAAAGASIEGLAGLWALPDGLAGTEGALDEEGRGWVAAHRREQRAFLDLAFADLAVDLDRRRLVRADLRPAYAPLATVLPDGVLPSDGLAAAPVQRGAFTPERARAARARGAGYRGHTWAASGRGVAGGEEMTAPQAAALLGIDVSVVRRTIRAGTLPARCAGGRYLIAHGQVAALLTARATAARGDRRYQVARATVSAAEVGTSAPPTKCGAMAPDARRDRSGLPPTPEEGVRLAQPHPTRPVNC